MNLNYKQSQFELFPGAGDNATKVNRSAILFSSITLSLENIVVVSIVMVMAVVLSFSIGVERGKKIIFSNNLATTSPSSMETAGATTSVKNNSIGSSGATTKSITTPKPSAVPSSSRITAVDIVKNETIQKATEKIVALPKLQEASPLPYTIQVASFARGEYAKKEAMALSKKGFDNFVVSKGKYSIVCVGKFLKKDEAGVTLTRLQKTYKDCMIRRL